MSNTYTHTFNKYTTPYLLADVARAVRRHLVDDSLEELAERIAREAHARSGGYTTLTPAEARALAWFAKGLY